MDKKDFLSELQGRGFNFKDKSDSEFGFNDEVLNMVYEMWRAGKEQAIPEGFVLMPKEPTQEMCNALSGNAENAKKIYEAIIKSQE